MAEVLSVQMPPERERQLYFSPSPIRRSPPSQNHHFAGSSSRYASPQTPERRTQSQHRSSFSSSDPSSASSSPAASHADISTAPSSFVSTPTSSLSLDIKYGQPEEISFPSYNDVGYLDPREEEVEPPPSPATDNSEILSSSSPSSGSSSPRMDHLPISEDDSAVREEPSRHVDYLSHEWREEDIWSSWKHIVANRHQYGQPSRLENASWRTWAKTKWRLRTVSPEKLNW
jgi:hypothetical protein